MCLMQVHKISSRTKGQFVKCDLVDESGMNLTTKTWGMSGSTQLTSTKFLYVVALMA